MGEREILDNQDSQESSEESQEASKDDGYVKSSEDVH